MMNERVDLIHTATNYENGYSRLIIKCNEELKKTTLRQERSAAQGIYQLNIVDKKLLASLPTRAHEEI